MNERDALLARLSEPMVPAGNDFSLSVWVLLLVLLAASVALAGWWWRYRQRNCWRREAVRELRQLRERVAEDSRLAILQAASQLTRRVALTLDARADTAALTGEHWLQRLDQLSASSQFTRGHGRLLLDTPYRQQVSLEAQDVLSLLELLQRLVRHGQCPEPSRGETG